MEISSLAGAGWGEHQYFRRARRPVLAWPTIQLSILIGAWFAPISTMEHASLWFPLLYVP
jgi:hypothetical protein